VIVQISGTKDLEPVLSFVSAVLGETQPAERIHVLVGSPTRDPLPGEVLIADADAGVAYPPGATTFGLSSAASVRAKDVELELGGTAFTAMLDGVDYKVRLQVIGEQAVAPALAAIAVAVESGVEPADAIYRLEQVRSLGQWRMQAHTGERGQVIVNDAWGATKDDMAAALRSLAQFAPDDRRSVAVLGHLDGDQADALEEHDTIGRLVVRLNINKLVVVGREARHIQAAAGLEGSWDGESVIVDTAEEAYDLLRDEIREMDVVLVKGAGSAALGQLGDRLAGVTA
jgi:UDP-N-acetylmuramoyl-tripeptide--D-alanyl-D-alanine ligase